MYAALALGLSAIFGVYVYYQFYLHPLARYPGPPLAKLTDFWQAYVCSTLRRVDYMREAHEKYGDIIRIGPNMLYINTADSIDQIYKNRKFLKAERYKSLESRDNIFCVTDPKEYARRHRLVAPAFSQKNMDRLEGETTRPLIHKWIAALSQRIQEDKSGIVDFTDWTDFIITDIIGAVSFGQSFGYIEQKENHPGLHLIQNIARVMTMISCMPKLKWALPFMISWKTLYRAMRYMRSIETYVRTCVERQDEGDPAASGSICAMLRNTKDESGDSLSVPELVDECTVFVIAGADTTSTAITNCLFYLAKHPEKQERLAREIRDAFETPEDIRARDLAKLPYLQAVLQEGMRMWPSVVGHQERVNYQEDSIISGYHVPKGTEIASSIMYITHDVRNFHDPNEFKPERWIDPDCKDNLSASQPMSVGARQCIGQNLGWQEMRLVLANLLWNFRLSPYDLVLDNRDISVTWRGKIRMRVCPRESKEVEKSLEVENLGVAAPLPA